MADTKLHSSEISTSDSDDSSRRKIGQVDHSFYIIGVGASAGGLEAIKQLVAQSETSFTYCFVIIQHISPNHKSMMTEILTRETGMTVQEVTDDMPVEGGNVYLIPPRSNVVIQGTIDDTQPHISENRLEARAGLRFSLIAPAPRPQLNLPIDIFFHSLAEAVGDRAIGVVLSGTGTDGSRGLRTIKNHDGFVMVQEPETAEFSGMPQAAITTKLVDLIAAPDVMMGELRRYVELRESGAYDVDNLFHDLDADLGDLIKRISATANIDFSQYKKPTLKRRIARRMALTQSETLLEYKKYVDDNPNELSILHREFLVGVTNFFRDGATWASLTSKVVPELFNSGDKTQPLKIWSVGCSTGEEAYTIALILEKYRRDNRIERDFKIFASDVNEDALISAKDGIYPESVVDEIPEEYRTDGFVSFHGGTFHVESSIRNRVIFYTHNVLQDPPYINTDLIVCRNLLIYLSPEMQKKIISLFSFSLRNEGHLLLGAAENVMHQFSKFETVVSSGRIYKNMRPEQRNSLRTGFEPQRSGAFHMPRMRRLATRDAQRSTNVLTPIFEASLENVNGALIIIDDQGNVIETMGSYKQFIGLPQQAFSANIFDLVHDRLKSAISILIRSADSDGRSESLATKCSFNDRIEEVDLFCRKIEWEMQPNAYSLFLRKTDTIRTPLTSSGAVNEALEGDKNTITRLESEIESLREMLSVTTEDLGISNEELQTANEELTVSNEELQANNEEMQSINEELHTVNAENAEKISQLENVNTDIENILNTIDLGVVFLNQDLTIRRFNPTFKRYVDLNITDIGRKLSNFASRFAQSAFIQLLEDIDKIRLGADEIRREFALKDGAWALVRIRPFAIGGTNEADGVAVSVLDITLARKLQVEVKRQRDRLESMLESEASGYWDWDIQNESEFLSPGFKEMLGFGQDELNGPPGSWRLFVEDADLEALDENLRQHIASKGAVPYSREVRFKAKSGAYVWILRRGRVTEWSANGRANRMIGIHVDISALKDREKDVADRAEQIFGFSYSTVHNLLQPLNTISQGLGFLSETNSDLSDVERFEMFDDLKSSARRMKQQVLGVREYSELYVEQLDTTFVSLNGIVSDILKDQNVRLSEVGASVVVGDIPDATANRNLVARVFQNLIGNSIKFRSHERACKITIEGRPVTGNMVLVRVQDNGLGIEETLREKIFDFFVRDDRGLRTPGIGAGLAVARRIVDMHGGVIRQIRSQEPGATFEFSLPMAAQSKTH